VSFIVVTVLSVALARLALLWLYPKRASWDEWAGGPPALLDHFKVVASRDLVDFIRAQAGDRRPGRGPPAGRSCCPDWPFSQG